MNQCNCFGDMLYGGSGDYDSGPPDFVAIGMVVFLALVISVVVFCSVQLAVYHDEAGQTNHIEIVDRN